MGLAMNLRDAPDFKAKRRAVDDNSQRRDPLSVTRGDGEETSASPRETSPAPASQSGDDDAGPQTNKKGELTICAEIDLSGSV